MKRDEDKTHKRNAIHHFRWVFLVSANPFSAKSILMSGNAGYPSAFAVFLAGK
jgi:hypothetical protein